MSQDGGKSEDTIEIIEDEILFKKESWPILEIPLWSSPTSIMS